MDKHSEALRIVGLYVLFAALYILFSDQLVPLLTDDPIQTARLQTTKGWAFVAITGALLYLLIQRSLGIVLASREAARRSEQYFRDTFDQAAVGIAHVGMDRRPLRVNQKMCDMLGYSAEELQALRVEDITHPDDMQSDLEQARRLLDDSIKTYTLEKRYLRKNGTTVWGNLTISLHRNAQGEPEYFIAVVEDISVRKAAEARAQHASSALDKALLQLVQALTRSVEKRDPYTAGHHEHTSRLAAAIAQRMGLPADDVEGIRLGAQLHDLGNIYVPTEILNRPGKLNDFEYALVKTHPQVGYDILKDVDLPWPVRDMILQHQERLDGSGYPQGLQGEAIGLGARIIAVADVVEAMTSHRPYRPALSLEQALAELRRGRGTVYDSRVVDACLDVIESSGLPWEQS
ncbi:HD-GYP domain-containing protein [Sulfurivermis fontis]|uniref:HD-GYP domain-containing protein n=1 Tax=Sulfurivermis fontis TaxID=1972068 RepID=UPI000FDBBC6D|nr:HD-GYP domain-containing protein [Sulfurivermis fontis]